MLERLKKGRRRPRKMLSDVYVEAIFGLVLEGAVSFAWSVSGLVHVPKR